MFIILDQVTSFAQHNFFFLRTVIEVNNCDRLSEKCKKTKRE